MEGVEKELQEIKRRLALVESQKAELSQLEEIRAVVDQRLRISPGRTAWEAPAPVKVQVEADNAEKDEDAKIQFVPDQNDVEDDPREYAMEESTWDAVLVCGLITKRGETFMIMLGCLLNLFIQLLYLLIVESTLAQPTITDKTLQHLAIWRMVIGHKAEHYDSLTQTSLVSRTCDDSGFAITSASQQGLHNQLSKYVPGGVSFTSPPILCVLSMFFWVLIALGDLVRTFDLARALASLPRSKWTRLHEEDGKTTLETIGRGRLLLLVIGVVLPKIAISIFMGIFGVRYLVFTKSAADLLLNAIALQFVLDTDELLFAKLMPMRVREVLANVQPLPINPSLRLPLRCRRKFPFRVASVLVLTLLTITVVGFTMLAHEIELTKEGLRLLCAGKRDFFYATDSATGTISISDTGTSKPIKNMYETYPFRAVLQKTDLMSQKSKHDILKGIPDPGNGTGADDDEEMDTLYLKKTRDQVMELDRFTSLQAGDNLSCLDLVSSHPAYTAAFSELNVTAATDCDWLRIPDCDQKLRAFCPETCGCSSLHTGLFNRVGCSSKCNQFANSYFLTSASTLRRQERYGEGICEDEYDSSVEMERYFNEVQALLLANDELLDQNESGFVKLSLWGHEGVALSSLYEYQVNPDVNIDLGRWAKESYMAAVNAEEPEKCGIVSFIYKVFSLDLCDMRGSLIFQGRVNSIKGICIKTCGHCTEPLSTPYKSKGWYDLVEWSNASLTDSPLRELNTTAGEECVIYGSLFPESMYWCPGWKPSPDDE